MVLRNTEIYTGNDFQSKQKTIVQLREKKRKKFRINFEPIEEKTEIRIVYVYITYNIAAAFTANFIHAISQLNFL